MQKNKWYTEKQIKRIMNDEVKKLHLAAHVLVDDVKTSFTMFKVSKAEGRKLVRRRKGRSKKASNYHVVSKPGEPPAVDTGKLRQSITYNVAFFGRNIILRVGSNMKYARRLEWGFMGRDSLGRNVKQLPRPWLYPAYRRRKQQIINLLSGK